MTSRAEVHSSLGVALPVLLLLAASVATGRQPPPKPTAPVGAPSANELLVESYLAGAKFPPQERAFQLMLLSHEAGYTDRGMVRLWSEELFQVCAGLPPGWFAEAGEKNALVALSDVDPAKSLALLRGMAPAGSDHPPEDLRAFGAMTIFERYWKAEGSKGIDNIRETARAIGDTGEYPYRAMAPVIKDVSKQDEAMSESLFADALSYYSQGSPYRDADSAFTDFLNHVWATTPLDLRSEALHAAVAQLETKKPWEEQEHFRARIDTSQGTIEATTRSQMLLYKLLPKIQEMDPDWARRVLQDLRHSSEPQKKIPKVESAQGSLIANASSASPEAVAAAEERLRELEELDKIQALAATDPQKAFQLAQSLGNPAYRLVGLAGAAEGFSGKDPARASDILDSLEQRVEKITNKNDKVKALAALERAAASMKRLPTFRHALREGLSLGEELFQEDLDAHPDKLSYQADVFGDLMNLAETGGRADPQDTVGALNEVGNQILRADLLIACAQGVEERQSKKALAPLWR